MAADDNSRPRKPLTTEEEERLYRERQAAREAADACEEQNLQLSPDVAPVPEPVACDDTPDTPEGVFLPANVDPGSPTGPELLPDGISVSSQAQSVVCDPNQVALAGSSPSLASAGYDVQLVYLDTAAAIPQDELFRLAAYVPAIQTLVDSDLAAAVNADDFTEFDQDLVTLTGVTASVAALIRGLLAGAQNATDLVALSYAQSGVVCGYQNSAFYVVCDAADPRGYITQTDVPPGTEGEDYVSVEQGFATSEISIEDAQDLAARLAAFDLDCLVGNQEVTKTCSDLPLSFDENTVVQWPTNWVIGSLASEYDFATWYDWETNVQGTPLGSLDGQEFITQGDVGSDNRTVLQTSVTISANDPAALAPTQAEADEIATNLALQQLNCFIPSRPRLLDCLDDVAGDVYARFNGRGLSDSVDADRQTLYEEMAGGPPATGGLPWSRANLGIHPVPLAGALTYEEEQIDHDQEPVFYDRPATGTDDGETKLDETAAFEVYVWPGFITGDTEAEANETAEAYGSGYLQCLWISPSWRCTCILDDEAGAQADSSKFASEEGATLNRTESSPADAVTGYPVNEVPRGQLLSDTYPNAEADPEYNDVPIMWPALEEICESGLQCFFEACQTAWCTPLADDRAQKVNGMPNYATWNNAAENNRPSSLGDQGDFLARWDTELASSLDALAAADICNDPCEIGADGFAGLASYSAIDKGPIDFGTPARFKFGGVLKLGNHWVSDSTISDDDLPIPGRTLACSEVVDPAEGYGPQTADPWGFYSGAEGHAEGFAPTGLVEQAVEDAKSRLDCTHLAWPRHLVTCPNPNQKIWGPIPYITDLAFEGSSTREANEAFESMILSIMECQDMHNFLITIRDDGDISMPGPSFAKLGEDDCIPAGLHPAILKNPDCTNYPTNGGKIKIDSPTHIFITIGCCPSGVEDDLGKKELFLQLIAGNFNRDDAVFAKQQGELGLADGRAALNTLNATGDGTECWYIASVWANSQFADDKVVVQAHSGPVLMLESCCDTSSSSSSDSSSSGSSGSSGGSGSSVGSGDSGGSGGGSGGGGSGGAGSDKSTAIVAMPWHQQGYGALFTLESNEVLFDFLLRDVELTGRVTRLPVDERFIWVCEADSLVVAGAPNGDKPRSIAATVESDGSLVLTSSAWPAWVPFLGRPRRATLRLTGVRKGFAGRDMPERSRRQYLANEEFLNSAYPAE